MIARLFRVRIVPGLRTQFEHAFHEVAIPAVEAHRGLVSVFIGKPTRWAPHEYFMISTWLDEAALVEFAGEDWNRPVIPAGMERFVEECWVHHYEIF